jgi:hypothetical protein
MKTISVALAATLSLSLPSTSITALAAGATDPVSHASTRVTGHQRTVVSSPDICPRTDAERLCANADDGSGRSAIDQRVPHQRAAEELIDHLNAIGWPWARKYNRYRQGQEETIVRWGQPGWPATYNNVSQCASFVTETLKYTYSHWATPSFFRTHFGNYSPFARDYHDAIADDDNPVPHFKRVTKVTDLRPGDLIAIKYPESKDPTGHVMLVHRATGREQTGPALDGARSYVVEVIDTTKDAHGSVGQSGAYRDTRITASAKETGAGYGHMVFYANKDRVFAGYRWSVTSHQIVPVEKHPVIAARITP